MEADNCEGHSKGGPLLTLRGKNPFLALAVVFSPGTPVFPTGISAKQIYSPHILNVLSCIKHKWNINEWEVIHKAGSV